jgi:hypothetical protein
VDQHSAQENTAGSASSTGPEPTGSPSPSSSAPAPAAVAGSPPAYPPAPPGAYPPTPPAWGYAPPPPGAYSAAYAQSYYPAGGQTGPAQPGYPGGYPGVPGGPPPPPPPAAPGYGAPPIGDLLSSLGAQSRVLLSRLDPTGWRPTIAVAAVILCLVFGMQIVDGAIPVPGAPTNPGGPGTPSGPGNPIVVADNVLVYPLAGWAQASTTDASHLQLQKGAVVFDLYVYPVSNVSSTSAASVLDAYVQQSLRQNSSQLQVSATQQVAVNGVTGSRLGYVGNFANLGVIEGEVTSFIRQSQAAGSVDIVVDAWATQGQLASGVNDVEQMIQTVAVR